MSFDLKNVGNPVLLAQEMVRYPTVSNTVSTVNDGIFRFVGKVLEHIGFDVERMDFDGTPNLYARLGRKGPNLCFAGHLDVVPTGGGWKHDPFGGVIENDILHGRGTADMKGAVAAAISAVATLAEKGPMNGSISFILSGDEEIGGKNGTPKVMAALKARGEVSDVCIVPENSGVKQLGDEIKIGRRGCENAEITAPDQRLLAAVLTELISKPLDTGNKLFEPSGLEITGLNGHGAFNIVPGKAYALIETPGKAAADALEGARQNQELLSPGVKISAEPRDGGTSLITVAGRQGHSAYPENFINPVRPLLRMLAVTGELRLIRGAIDPEDLENGSKSTALVNVRMNPLLKPGDLAEAIKLAGKKLGGQDVFQTTVTRLADPFVTPPGWLTDLMSGIVKQAFGREPALTTTGGTTDARYIAPYCPVAELGLMETTMHQVNEQVPTPHLEELKNIFQASVVRIHNEWKPEATPAVSLQMSAGARKTGRTDYRA